MLKPKKYTMFRPWVFFRHIQLKLSNFNCICQLYMPIVYVLYLYAIGQLQLYMPEEDPWSKYRIFFSVFNIFTYYELKATIHLPFMFRKTCLKRPTEIPRHETIQHWRAICMYIRSRCRLHPPPNTGEGFFAQTDAA